MIISILNQNNRIIVSAKTLRNGLYAQTRFAGFAPFRRRAHRPPQRLAQSLRAQATLGNIPAAHCTTLTTLQMLCKASIRPATP
jgi:hypothetical protein